MSPNLKICISLGPTLLSECQQQKQRYFHLRGFVYSPGAGLDLGANTDGTTSLRARSRNYQQSQRLSPVLHQRKKKHSLRRKHVNQMISFCVRPTPDPGSETDPVFLTVRRCRRIEYRRTSRQKFETHAGKGGRASRELERIASAPLDFKIFVICVSATCHRLPHPTVLRMFHSSKPMKLKFPSDHGLPAQHQQSLSSGGRTHVQSSSVSASPAARDGLKLGHCVSSPRRTNPAANSRSWVFRCNYLNFDGEPSTRRPLLLYCFLGPHRRKKFLAGRFGVVVRVPLRTNIARRDRRGRNRERSLEKKSQKPAAHSSF